MSCCSTPTSVVRSSWLFNIPCVALDSSRRGDQRLCRWWANAGRKPFSLDETGAGRLGAHLVALKTDRPPPN